MEENYGKENYSEVNNVEQNNTKKRTKFSWKSFAIGTFAGLVASVLLVVVSVNIYARVSGQYLVVGLGRKETVEDVKVLDKKTAEKVSEISQYMDLYYYEDYDVEEVRNGILHGFVDGLGDPYSVYYTKEEYEEMNIQTTGTYYGIGAGLRQDPKTMEVTVSKVYSGTPAEEAGLLKDDVILYVDDIDATSMELSKLVQNIRGEEGTKVHLKIYRDATKETLEFDVERRNVELPSVEGKLLEDGIGYIQISEFQTNTAAQFDTQLKALMQQGATGFVVDLRDNPGGLLSAVTEILDELLPEGLIVYTEDKYGKREEFKSDEQSIDLPMVVLVNGNSASASEIFAGAVKDHGYAKIIGTTTYGKGIVQKILKLSDDDALKMTIAKYYTPNGNYIHGVGIEPDIEIEYEVPEDGVYNQETDNQLKRAVEVLKEEL
ncbi:MAG: S41 family peptidase [Agathobacter sp.]|nr:S41 family peptidase [Agathobacter sp.]